MNATDWSEIRRVWHDRREAIAESWCNALTSTSVFVPIEATNLLQHITTLTEQVIAVLSSEPFERAEARNIGLALTKVHYVQPEALGQTHKVLMCQLVEGLTPTQVVALQPRLATLLGAVASGFFQHAREVILTEQEQVRHALLSEVRRTEEALRKSEERYRTLFENAPIGMGVVDNDGNILALNDTMLITVGGRREEVASKNIADLCPDPDKKSKVFAALRDRASLRGQEMRIIRQDGTYCDVLLSLTPAIWEGKHCWQIMALDITAHKEAEKQARRAERMAAMGRLTMALAHELNNPLQAIRSNLELAMDFDLGPEEQQDCLHIVRQEIERLGEITRRVLDFAHPTDDTRYPISIVNMAKKTLGLIRKQLELAHIQVTTEFPADLPPIFAAPDQIVQVCLNLSINAIEAMPDGGRLHITGYADEDEVVLTLANSGPPIPEEQMAQIFDPFFTTKERGTGLGLPVSHSIVHHHGGTISARNLADGQGVAFTVRLPIVRKYPF